jgi:hypothetical protein
MIFFSDLREVSKRSCRVRPPSLSQSSFYANGRGESRACGVLGWDALNAGINPRCTFQAAISDRLRNDNSKSNRRSFDFAALHSRSKGEDLW